LDAAAGLWDWLAGYGKLRARVREQRYWGKERDLRRINVSNTSEYFNWMHFGVNTDRWIITTQGTGFTPDNNHKMMLYHTQQDSVIRTRQSRSAASTLSYPVSAGPC